MQASLDFAGCREATSEADHLRQRVVEQEAHIAAIGQTPRLSGSASTAYSTPEASVISSQAQHSREQQDVHINTPRAVGCPPEQQRIERAASTNPLFVPRPDRDASSQQNSEQIALIDHLQRQVAELQQLKESIVQPAAIPDSPLDRPSPAPHQEPIEQLSPVTTAALSAADSRSTMPASLQQQMSLSIAASVTPPATNDAACNTTCPVGCQTDPIDSATSCDLELMAAAAEHNERVACPPAVHPTQSQHLQCSKHKSSTERSSSSNSGTSSDEGVHDRRISKWKARCRQLRKALTESHETIAATSTAQAGPVPFCFIG